MDQLSRISAEVEELIVSNPFYKDRLHPIRDWDDFYSLPFTTKSELVEDQLTHPPFGTNLTYPLDHYVRLHQTSGTSGRRPLRWLDTAESWKWWCDIWREHVYKAAGVTKADRVFLAFSFGPFIGFWSAFGGAERLGAMVISGGAMTTEQRVQAILDLEPTVLCCTPTYALRLAETARRMGYDLSSSSIKTTIHAGEPGASIPATKRAIEEAFGARCFDHTGMTELGPTGYSCMAGGGVHLIESEFILEVIPEGTPPIPHGTMPEGVGELVATNLGRLGSPLIRYRTGDLVELSYAPCPCGSPFPKVIGGIKGRVDDMFTVRGVNLYPSQVEEVLRHYPTIVEFQIRHRKVHHMDEVSLIIETEDDGSLLLEQVSAELRHAFGVRIDCECVPLGTLPRHEMKAQRVVHDLGSES